MMGRMVASRPPSQSLRSREVPAPLSHLTRHCPQPNHQNPAQQVRKVQFLFSNVLQPVKLPYLRWWNPPMPPVQEFRVLIPIHPILCLLLLPSPRHLPYQVVPQESDLLNLEVQLIQKAQLLKNNRKYIFSFVLTYFTLLKSKQVLKSYKSSKSLLKNLRKKKYFMDSPEMPECVVTL